jgi:tetratricopeptide (TPR) repeat protein
VYAHVLRQRGEAEESVREARRSVELDPVNVLANLFIGQGLLEARHYDQAVAQLRETLVLNANFWPAHLYLGMTLLQQSHYPEAIEELRKAGDLTAEPYATIGYVYARMGRRADALKVLADLKERSKHEYVAPCFIAKIYIALGDREQAFAWFEKGYQQRDSWLTFLKGDPMYDPIRSDPRFGYLLRRVGLPP